MLRFPRALAALLITLILPAAGPLISLAAQGDPKKVSKGFEHVHALAMDAEGRSLYLGALEARMAVAPGGRWRSR